MNIFKTNLPDLYLIEPKIFEDSRGYFFESYNKNILKENGIEINFVQDNQSKSSYGVIRGLHYQLNPHPQTKLVRVLAGKILDVVVDIRKNSPTFGKWQSFELSDDNKHQLLVTVGFAHGFSVLSNTAIVLYKCDDFYNPQLERGIVYNDPALSIDWDFDENDAIVSEKDAILPLLKDAETNF